MTNHFGVYHSVGPGKSGNMDACQSRGSAAFQVKDMSLNMGQRLIARSGVNVDTDLISHGPRRHEDSRLLTPVSYTHLRAHETKANLVCRLLLEKKKNTQHKTR